MPHRRNLIASFVALFVFVATFAIANWAVGGVERGSPAHMAGHNIRVLVEDDGGGRSGGEKRVQWTDPVGRQLPTEEEQQSRNELLRERFG